MAFANLIMAMTSYFSNIFMSLVLIVINKRLVNHFTVVRFQHLVISFFIYNFDTNRKTLCVLGPTADDTSKLPTL